MKNFKKILLPILFISMVSLSLVGCNNETSDKKGDSNSSSSNNFNIVASFYPMHILTMNLTDGIDNVNLTSMSDPNMGCIHDHTFTTDDLKKVEKANAFVENGLELEVFNDKITSAYPDVQIIEASKDVKDLIKSDEGTNAHVWTNIDNYMQQIKTVSTKLQSLDKDNSDKYKKNEEAYIKSLEDIKSKYKDSLSKVAGKKALILDETLPYFCQFTKIDYISIESDHEQESVSADVMKNTIKTMNDENIKAIFIAKDSNRSVAETVAKETGAKIYELNTCMVGKVDKNAYIDDMSENFETISNME